MKRYIIILALMLGITIEAGAVLKEKNLEETLTILRSELTKHYHELTSQREEREEQIGRVALKHRRKGAAEIADHQEEHDNKTRLLGILGF